MLVLTRKKEQALMIGDNIEIKVLDIQGDQIRLGVEAPKNVKIFRKEIYLEIQEENKNAVKYASRIPAEGLKSILNIPPENHENIKSAAASAADRKEKTD